MALALNKIQDQTSKTLLLWEMWVWSIFFTEDGKWRIKVFRKTEFENVIEARLIVTSISIIFLKEFNELLEEVKQHQNAEEKTD